MGGPLHNRLRMARNNPIIPEVIEPDEKLPRDLVALRRFAWLMDEWLPIPGTGLRMGLGSGIALVPGIGDAISALLATWVIIGALRHRVALIHVGRMIMNVILDLIIGEIPIVGDIFDIAFEENVRNVRLLLARRDRSKPPRSFAAIAFMAALVVAFIAAVALGLLVAMIIGVIWLIHQR